MLTFRTKVILRCAVPGAPDSADTGLQTIFGSKFGHALHCGRDFVSFVDDFKSFLDECLITYSKQNLHIMKDLSLWNSQIWHMTKMTIS